MITLNEIRKNQSELKLLSVRALQSLWKTITAQLDVTDFDSTPIIMEDLERSDFSYNGQNSPMMEMEMSSVHCSNCEDNETIKYSKYRCAYRCI